MSLFIDKLLKCLPKVRDAFYASGFELPLRYLADVESARIRGNDEHDYQHYMDEALREEAISTYSWPSGRALLKPDQRSAYLDMLAARFPNEVPTSSLDPNFNRFMKLEDEVQIKRLGEYRDQKQKEQEQHATELQELIGHSSLTLVNGIIRIAEQFGYSPKHKIKARDDALDLAFTLDQPIQSLIRVTDLYALRKRGSVTAQYFFAEMPDVPFGLSSFVPGGHLYSSWNKNPQAIFFSFYVNCKFMTKCIKGINKEYSA
jgi:hypothetical protein